MNTKILQLNSGKQNQLQNPDDLIVVVVRHSSQPHNKPIQTEVTRRWAIGAVKEAWAMFLASIPASERKNFSISFDEAHLNRNARGFGK
jgi:hypothetical protein